MLQEENENVLDKVRCLVIGIFFFFVNNKLSSSVIHIYNNCSGLQLHGAEGKREEAEARVRELEKQVLIIHFVITSTSLSYRCWHLLKFFFFSFLVSTRLLLLYKECLWRPNW